MGDGDSTTKLERPRPELVDGEVEPIRQRMVLAGRYVVEEIIGRGGMGVVVRAHDRTLGETVGIKIVRAEYAGEAIWSERLAREVKLARQIQHPNVCRVFDVEKADGRVFLVMELATQGTLRSEIAAGTTRGRPLAETLADVRAIADGLAAIHAAGIVHRDISPQNVLRMGDGRLVVSDFGLATDPSEGTTSVRGGTVAYMAPEIMRGGNAGFASDIWALGAVIYETVFGERPTWQLKRGPEMVAPARTLTREEQAIFEVCRACTAADPKRRPAGAGAVSARLTEAALGRRDWRPWRARVGVILCAAAVVAAGPAVWKRLRRPAAVVAPAVNAASPMLEIVGEPADWTNTSRVLAEIPELVRCVVPLPDRHTVRLVWRQPPRAEDVDTKTGRRVPSPIVPAAYAEACPDLSPDGKRLLYQGHTPDGRAFAFVAENSEGRDAVPVVPTAEPTHLSEPRWLPDGSGFSYDVDTGHMGTYSLKSRRSNILPALDADSYLTSFRWTAGGLLFVATTTTTEQTEFFGYDPASLRQVERFRFPTFAYDLQTGPASTYYITLPDVWSGVAQLDLAHGTARRRGFVRGQAIRFITPVEGGAAFVSRVDKATVTLSGAEGRPPATFSVERSVDSVARCGGGGLLLSEGRGGSWRIVRRTGGGQMLGYATEGPNDLSVSCTRDGRWFYVRVGSREPGLVACSGDRCAPLFRGAIWRASVSPDGLKVAVVSMEKRGPIVSWFHTNDPQRTHRLRETETACTPIWTSETAVWISERRGPRFAWVEVDLSGRETGRVLPGADECSSGAVDTALPGDPGIAFANQHPSQLRVISADAIGH